MWATMSGHGTCGHYYYYQEAFRAFTQLMNLQVPPARMVESVLSLVFLLIVSHPYEE